MNLRVALIAGTRPEVLKLYPLVLALTESKIECLFVSTAQQKDLMNQTLKSLNMEVDIDLDLMRENQSPISFLTRAQEAITDTGGDFYEAVRDIIAAKNPEQEIYNEVVARSKSIDVNLS